MLTPAIGKFPISGIVSINIKTLLPKIEANVKYKIS
jgi:hypothetical protein